MADRKSTRLNSSHTEIYPLSLHDALPISVLQPAALALLAAVREAVPVVVDLALGLAADLEGDGRSEEHTSELQSHRDLPSFPTRRSSDLCPSASRTGPPRRRP